jgi:tyrosyl-tRNA synthetase
VKIDGEKIEDQRLAVKKGSEHVYQVGKRRFAKIRLL